MKVFQNNNITYKVGTNADENWHLISKADPTEFWVHLDNVPSSHVIIEIDDILPEDLQYAGMLCKAQSKCSAKNMSCVATTIGNLKFGSKAGEVYFKNPKDIIQFVC
jgi:predicted ribosome quality control (RQC) complex YloA/Tae2 family protein